MIKSLAAMLPACVLRTWVLPAGVLLASTVLAAAPCNIGSPAGRYVRYDAIVYGANPRNVLNLFLPSAAQRASLGITQAAATLVIHGRGGHYDDAMFSAVCAQLAVNGIACASIEYPDMLSGSAIWESYAAVNCALRWLRANGARYRYRADRIGIYGGSYGGLLAMWQVATQSMTRTPNQHQSVIQPGCPNAATPAGVEAAVIQYGVSDLSLLIRPRSNSAAAAPDAAAAAAQGGEFSPITYLTKAIPQVLSVGDYDTTVNPANTGEWIRRLIALGGKYTYVDPTNRAACAIGAVCGGGFTGLSQYWDLGGFGHGYQIFSNAANGPNRLVVPNAYSCSVVAFYWKALLQYAGPR